MTRTFGKRFNRLYNTEYFPEPQAFNFGNQLVKIPGLNGSGKMGKSEGEGNAIYLADEPEAIRKKVMKAVTDSGPTEPNQEKPDAIKNIFQLMNVVSSQETFNYFDEMYNTCQIRYGDMKKQLAEDMINFTTPFREKIKAIAADEVYLSKVAAMGKEKAQANAAKTINDVREIIGFKKF
jgi:tryptophanyl-tRNA synthetase